MYAQVAFPFYRFQSFTYKIPDSLASKVHNGVCVKAPFRNKSKIGFIISIDENTSYLGKVYEIVNISEEDLSIPIDLWKTIEWISSYYYTPIGTVLKTAIALSFKKTQNPQKIKFIEITPSGLEAIKNIRRAPSQKALLQLLAKANSPIDINSLKYKIQYPSSIAKSCAQKGFVTIKEKNKIYNPLDFIQKEKVNKIQLNKDQNIIFKKITYKLKSNTYSSHYIHGVTGSGKTEIYIRLVQEILKMNKTAIILLPEISLTPQTASRFKSHLGSKIGLWHSKLSQAERFWTWKQIKTEKFKIIIGARSALFTPLKNLGLIVIDEEHDFSFKQEQSAPYYNARDSALVRAKLANASVVLGSATPSLEMYYNGIIKKLNWYELNKRYGKAVHPHIKIIDMKNEINNTNITKTALSKELINHIGKRLSKNEQIILLQNRRGYAIARYCIECGELTNCNYCSVSLTYHKQKNIMMCHYCNFSINLKSQCYNCNSINLELSGSGTQKIEEELNNIFPDAQILRMDFDTVRGKHSHHKILEKFRNKQANILLGTQMIAKGLDFPDVTLVGVINGDTGLFLPDFRAEERNFQLIYQVTGRAGRHKKAGLAIIQTLSPNTLSISCASQLDLKRFYNVTLSQRQELNYPPFSRIARFIIIGNDKKNVIKRASSIKSIFYSLKEIQVLGPTQAPIEKIKNKWRYHLLIKYKKNNPNLIQKTLDKYRKVFLETPINGVTVRLDIDPVNII